MIHIEDVEIGDCKHERFTIINGLYVSSAGKGYTQIHCRSSDMKCEGVALFLEATNEIKGEEYNFTPFELDKNELKSFIEYLIRQYDSMPN